MFKIRDAFTADRCFEHIGFIMNQFIITKNISKNFSGVQALQDVSISIHSGEIRCLAGENGSRKSTFIKVIAGTYKPDSGRIFINGKAFKNLHPIVAIREGIQVIYQDFSLFPNLTVAENLAINTLLEHNRRFVNWHQVNQIARTAIAQIDVELDLNQLVAELSVAEKQLIASTHERFTTTWLALKASPYVDRFTVHGG